MTLARTASVSSLLAVACLCVSACGGGSDDEARALQERSIITNPEPVSVTMIKGKDLEREDAGSVERAFLEYWSALQFEAWQPAANFYAAGLREFIGEDRLLRALAGQAGIFLSNRPVISRVDEVDGDTVLKYILRDTADNETPRSQAWRRIGGEWRIVYDAFLDRALAEARQLEVQVQVDPNAQKPSPEALRAGAEARRLQSRYAAQGDDLTTP